MPDGFARPISADSRFTAAALTLPKFLDVITRKIKILRKLQGGVMELWQAFLLGMMVAWTPGLIVLAVLLREIKTARAHHAWQ